jgi:hypothetical protein
MEGVTVALSPEGVPMAFRVAGDSWRVAEEPVRWYERIPWWETASRMPREHGRIDVEVWQLQARLERGRNRSSLSEQPLVTFVLVRDQNTGEWAVRSAAENPD